MRGLHLGLGLTSGGVALLNPASLSPSLWYSPGDSSTVFKDAGSTLAVNGTDTVQQLNDKSGNTKNMSQATSAKRPSFATANGKPCLTFDGTQTFLSLTSAPSISQPCTLALAAIFTNGAAAVGNLFDSAGGRSAFGAMSSTNYRIFNGSTVSYGTRDSSAHACIVSFNGSSSTIQIDSTVSGSLNPGANGGPTTTFYIGSDNAGASQFFAGQLFEWMLIPRLLTAGETTAMVTYLKSRAGL